MAKAYAEMSVDELTGELEVWWNIIDQPKGPETPSNGARRGAEREVEAVEAWLARRHMGQ